MAGQAPRALECVGGNVVSTMHQLPVLPMGYLWYSFLLEADLQKHSEARRIYSMNKIPLTALGIQPATLRLLVQSLSQLHHYVPEFVQSIILYVSL